MKYQTSIKTLVQDFEQKNIFSDISLSRLGKNMSIALENMTESPPPPLPPQKKRKKEKNIKLYPIIVKSLVLD